METKKCRGIKNQKNSGKLKRKKTHFTLLINIKNLFFASIVAVCNGKHYLKNVDHKHYIVAPFSTPAMAETAYNMLIPAIH